uniref:Uncharacterized protein n=1 Tax=Panagrolaimus sp. ES5 TaxID=591445 RepID=A0AC34F917_9BILA
MRQFIFIFLFIAFVSAADDALIETESGPKSSADLIKDASAQPDVAAIDKIPLGAAVGTTVVKDDAKADVIADAVAKAEAAENKSKSSESKESKEEEVEKVEAVPKETVAVAHKKPGEEAEVATATKVEIKPVAAARVKREEKEVESVLEEGAVIDVGAAGDKAAVAQSKAIANKSKSSESKESKEEEKEVAETDATKVEAVPKETVAVAHKKPGEEPEVATATKVELKPVEPEAAAAIVAETRAKRAEEVQSVLKEGAVIDVGAVGDKTAVAQSKAIADKSKSSESKESKEDEQKEAENVEAVKVSKVPTEEIAVAHKKAGDDEVKVATATEATIVAEKIQKSRARRFA